jgi:folate-binding protein YgfZ
MLLAMQDSLPRSILLIPLEHAPALWQQLSAEAHRIGEKAWSMFDIKAGIAWVGKSGTEEFLPQSLNLDLTGGLSFTKGCYPGQEIIARMHFRGKLKQRLFLANVAINEPPQITTKLYSTDVTKHIGVVANATMQNENNCLMLVVLELEYATSGPIHLGEENGPVLNLEALPYSPDSV